MPVGYLISVLLVGSVTLLAIRPVYRPEPLGLASFLLTLLINEVPIAGLYLLLPATALAFAQGDIGTPGGWAVFGLALLVVLGLAVIARRTMLAGPAVERALAEGLGAGWRSETDPALRAGLRRGLPLGRILFLPFVTRRRDVTHVKNLSYGDAGKRNLLDVYHHRSRPSGGPILIHLHGGHYSMGRKDSQALPLIYRLASQGWVCISANYRLRPAVRHPEHLVDYKRVIAWAREHAEEYGADPAMIFASGTSAGGHMASIAGLTADDPDLQPGFEDVDTSVAGVIILNGYLGRYFGQGPESSPLGHVRPDAPPYLIAHGDHDSLVSPDVNRPFVEGLRRVSRSPVVYAELPGAQHGFDLYHSVRFETLINGIEAFAAWVRTGRARPRPGGRGSPAGHEVTRRTAR
ncbi:alpha/beta hydrolase [Nocardioides sp. LHD-245]|uniref:alpha/beta hydrolase n=1 Tax=Nocardioides sp. LHD-245 TaxID=3051387 RepID=UPI0027E099AB|nr:alpha/beta hydrolase [Nocardioides sp. LHD-245]